MFGKKKQILNIDKAQLELIENAQQRIKQKKRLYIHFILFLIGSVCLILANTVFNIGKDFTIFGKEWFLFATIAWLLLLIYHFINVFITHKFMGKVWEKKQLDKLVNQQQYRIEKLKQEFLKEEILIAQSQAYSEAESTAKVSETPPNKLTIIVAVGENNEIGKDNNLIWHLSDDLKHFKKLTNGHHIIMGRKTFESFPKPLPNRTHIVITRQKDYKASDGVIVVNSLDDAINAAKSDNQPFIIGGGEIYKQAMDIASKIEITRVHNTFDDADTFFPEIDDSKWKEKNRIMHSADEKHKFAFSFITYEKQ